MRFDIVSTQLDDNMRKTIDSCSQSQQHGIRKRSNQVNKVYVYDDIRSVNNLNTSIFLNFCEPRGEEKHKNKNQAA